MNHESNRVRSVARRALSARGPRSLVLVLSLALPTAAQRMIVSTTDDVSAAATLPFPVSDGDLVAVERAVPVVPFFAGGHFQGTAGFTPTDIDAYANLPTSLPGRGAGHVFSLLSNEGGFLDGDLLVIGTGGVSLLVSELDLATALGVPGANLDVDALTYDDQGRILFSLTTDQTGTTLGTVLDGDILRLELGFAGVTRFLSEADVQARVSQSTGLNDPILDVQALDWATGELWVAVQSPSRHDGSILAVGQTPRLVLDEAEMGLAGAEVDALAEVRPGDETPVFHMSPAEALPGDVLHIETRGRAGAALVVFMAGNTGSLNLARFPGFGELYLDPADPWLNMLLATQRMPVVQLDGNGEFHTDWPVPAGTQFGTGFGGELGWSFQLMDVGTREFSAPFRVVKL